MRFHVIIPFALEAGQNFVDGEIYASSEATPILDIADTYILSYIAIHVIH